MPLPPRRRQDFIASTSGTHDRTKKTLNLRPESFHLFTCFLVYLCTCSRVYLCTCITDTPS